MLRLSIVKLKSKERSKKDDIDSLVQKNNWANHKIDDAGISNSHLILHMQLIKQILWNIYSIMHCAMSYG